MTEKFPNLHIVKHPLVQHKLTLMRDKNCTMMQFRILLKEIAMLVGYEITHDLALTTATIETPLTKMDAPHLAEKTLAVVPILRAGLGMADGLMELIPTAEIGHIGLYRDHETLQPVEYLRKLPPYKGQDFIVVDPMLATGHSGAYACDLLNQYGVPDKNIRFMALVAAPEGVEVFHRQHPEIPVYLASLDSHLNENGYIVPGLGDAGDRLFGTK